MAIYGNLLDDILQENTKEEKDERKEISRKTAKILQNYVKSKGIKLYFRSDRITARNFKNNKCHYVDYYFANFTATTDLIISLLMYLLCPFCVIIVTSEKELKKLRLLLDNIDPIQKELDETFPEWNIKVNEYNKQQNYLRVHFNKKEN